MRRTVQRLVGLFIWFSAVLLWPIVFNVTVSSLFFALSIWKVHCTCGSQLFLCPTSAFTFAPLVARNGGTPCWLPLFIGCSWLRSKIVSAPCVTFVSQLWRVHCACRRRYISGANVTVQRTAHFVRRTLESIVGCFHLFLNLMMR